MQRNPDWKNTGWGSRNGRAVRVSEVPRGLACGCVCPGCGGKLVAKKGTQRAHHFAHANIVDCDGLGESALHLACKEVIQEYGEMALPYVVASDGRYDGTRSYEHQEHDLVAPSKRVRFDAVKPEHVMGSITPDITATANGHTLCVEIKVTHAADDEKSRYYETLHQSAIEVDASDLPRDALRHVIKERVIDCTKHKRWIYNTRAAERLESCTKKDRVPVFVDCPLPVKALLDNIPDNGWRNTAKRSAYKRNVHSLYNCLYCKHALCMTGEHIFCDATEYATRDYTRFPGGFYG